jgi:general stress protein CsbA
MKRIFIYAGLVLSVVMTACSAKKTYSYSEYRVEQPTQSVHAVPVVADLEVAQERITYSERLGVKVSDLSDNELQQLVEKEKGLVMNNAMKAHGADVLVAPLVDIQTDLKNQLVITVTAYPAKYKNYRNATKEDEWFINVPMVEIK